LVLEKEAGAARGQRGGGRKSAQEKEFKRKSAQEKECSRERVLKTVETRARERSRRKRKNKRKRAGGKAFGPESHWSWGLHLPSSVFSLE
jgi:hypothetical protein